MTKPNVLLLNSGGLDSMVVAKILANQGYNLYSLYIDYGMENSEQALASAKNISNKYCTLGHEVLSLHSDKRDNFSTTYRKTTDHSYAGIPFSGTVNALLGSLIAHNNDIGYVAGGRKNDLGNDVDYWLESLRTLMSTHQNYREPVIFLKPIGSYTTVKETVDRGLKEGLTLEEMSETVSCPFKEPCGICLKCINRTTNGLVN